MKIVSSQVELASQREFLQQSKSSESLRMWTGQRPNEETAQQQATNTGTAAGNEIMNLIDSHLQTLRQAAEAMQLQTNPGKNNVELHTTEEMQNTVGTKEELESEIMRQLLERFLGEKLHRAKLPDAAKLSQSEAPANPVQSQQSNWGVEYEYHAEHFESETTNFSARGIIKTADGRQIDIEIDLRMSREFYHREDISIRAGNAVTDPLVINYGGNSAELSKQKFSFDLDIDGQADEISTLRGGSGFLALDKNGDGLINDGSELFGPTRGDGFVELAEHDRDSNGWIDENDAIFNRLAIWSPDGQGNGKLVGLVELGVGAIFLGNTSTEFHLNDAMTNQTNGKIRSSGIFLFENGLPGTVQQIDMAL